MTPRRSITEKRWIRGFIVASLAITAAIMLTALPACQHAARNELVVGVKDDMNISKSMKITYDRKLDNVIATVDGKKIEISPPHPFPVTLGAHSKKIVGIYTGPFIVFEGSDGCTCYPTSYGLRCIPYPPGTPCP
jgi:hypothetical protein